MLFEYLVFITENSQDFTISLCFSLSFIQFAHFTNISYIIRAILQLLPYPS